MLVNGRREIHRRKKEENAMRDGKEGRKCNGMLLKMTTKNNFKQFFFIFKVFISYNNLGRFSSSPLSPSCIPHFSHMYVAFI